MKPRSREFISVDCPPPHWPGWLCSLVCLVAFGAGSPSSAQQWHEAPPPPEPPAADEAPYIALNLPGEPSHAPADGGGFFPTLSETALLRGPYDARSYAGNYTVDSPDRRGQLATDIFPYQDPVPNFYQRNERFYKPMDHFFGFLTPFDTFTYENERLRNFAFSMDANVGVLTRNFTPELAMVKAGPLFLDVLWIGTGVLWSDYTGPLVFADGDEDGWTGYIELGLRLAARLTDTIYLTAGANIIYLPWENEFAFRALTGNVPGIAVNLVYSDDWGPWSVSFYDRFFGRMGFDLLSPLDEEGLDRAGRYWFGIQQRRANEFYSGDDVFFTNVVGTSATRLVFDNQWRWWLEADHTDFWRTFDFDDHAMRDHFGTWLGYEGSVIPFAPRFFYDVWDLDGLFHGRESLLHNAGLALTGRLTENINWYGDVSYLFDTGPDSQDRDNVLWNMRFTHNITRDLTHSLGFGQGLFFNDFANEVLVSRYINYRTDYRLSRRSSLSAFVQYADQEVDLITNDERTRYGGGASINFLPLDFTGVRLLAFWEHIEQDNSDFEQERWILRGEITQRLGLRLSAQLFYQYEDNDAGPASFNEHVTGLSVRRYF